MFTRIDRIELVGCHIAVWQVLVYHPSIGTHRVQFLSQESAHNFLDGIWRFFDHGAVGVAV